MVLQHPNCLNWSPRKIEAATGIAKYLTMHKHFYLCVCVRVCMRATLAILLNLKVKVCYESQ